VQNLFSIIGERLVLFVLGSLRTINNSPVFDQEHKVDKAKAEHLDSHIYQDAETDTLIDDWEERWSQEHRNPTYDVQSWQYQLEFINVLEIPYIHWLLLLTHSLLIVYMFFFIFAF
jgi:hypothetical protein